MYMAHSIHPLCTDTRTRDYLVHFYVQRSEPEQSLTARRCCRRHQRGPKRERGSRRTTARPTMWSVCVRDSMCGRGQRPLAQVRPTEAKSRTGGRMHRTTRVPTHPAARSPTRANRWRRPGCRPLRRPSHRALSAPAPLRPCWRRLPSEPSRAKAARRNGAVRLSEAGTCSRSGRGLKRDIKARRPARTP